MHLKKKHLKYNSDMDTDKAKKIVKKFIKNNPYPEYNDIVKMLTKNFNECRESNDREFAIHYLNLFSEYGTPNDEWMKEIYENITDEKINKRKRREDIQ